MYNVVGYKMWNAMEKWFRRNQPMLLLTVVV